MRAGLGRDAGAWTMGVRVCVAGLLAVATWGGAAQAQGRYAEPGSYGGGLIEYLVNGSAGAPPAA
ncbi:hypothetical protein ACFQ12_04265, partial [Methylobacterium trifolii]